MIKRKLHQKDISDIKLELNSVVNAVSRVRKALEAESIDLSQLDQEICSLYLITNHSCELAIKKVRAVGKEI